MSDLITKKVRLIASIAIAASLIMPFFIHAQTALPSALDATIRAAIMQDPRSASLTLAQINAMVTALSTKAQTQGLTAQKIAYRPDGLYYRAGLCTEHSNRHRPMHLDHSDVGYTIGSGLVRNAVYAAFWILSLFLIVIVWHMRKNPHLIKTQEVHNTPVTGGGI